MHGAPMVMYEKNKYMRRYEICVFMHGAFDCCLIANKHGEILSDFIIISQEVTITYFSRLRLNME